MRYYVVSDVHGFYNELIDSLKKEGFFDDPLPHKLLVDGDILDRGDQAKEMVDFILDLIEKDQIILVKGNHEDLIVEFIDNIEKYYPNILESHHFRNSTVDSVCQLLDVDLIDIYDFKDEIRERMYKHPFFTKIIPSCVDYYETKNYIFTHGYIPMITSDKYGRDKKYEENKNWRNASSEQWHDARWYNGMDADLYRLDRTKTIAVGHWHCSYGHSVFENDGSEHGDDANYSPFIRDKFICIDGCVPRSFHVNCIVIEDDEL